MEKTFTDNRINNMLCMYEYEGIANEYLQREFGRTINGGCSMGGMLFEAISYRKDNSEPTIEVIIDYKDRTITMITK